MNNIPIFEAVFNSDDEIQLISFVDKPAIETNFVAFSNEKERQYFNEDQQIIVSPVMIPDKMIYRFNDEIGGFYTFFSKDNIEKIRYQYAKDGNFNNANLNHKDSIDGIIMLESWIKEFDNDKSSEYGFTDLPVGTWFVKYKVDNIEVWNKIKNKEINGLSIEGYISYEQFHNKEVKKVSYSDKLLTIFNKKPIKKFNDILIEYFSNCGITEEKFLEEFAQADLIPHKEGDILPKDSKAGRTFYKYVGPNAERDFCRQLISLNRLYTFDEIKQAKSLSVNAGFGPNGTSTYDIWFYKGGPNCKHYWQKVYATLRSQQSKGPAVGKAGTPMKDQPNHGYLKASEEQFEIKPLAGETKDEYIGRCVGIEVSNGMESSQAAAICYTKWDNK
ncbi:Phage-like element PBSX protein, XkdF [uncultured Caudovirales phage]|uniref:Phage-like element PBSX protein, XkdF n=1 Tax=uncultured Caudovirales phage TaxID=2100421 RepID=A0A6J5N616_9CAUD|nr:Phage-like element PBSX protein, XkdF [uncultured Caudovirales phage]